MKIQFVRAIAAGALIVAVPALSLAEENFDDLLKRAKEYKEQGQFRKAIDELSWATKQLSKLHTDKLQSFFPPTAGGFQGGEFEANDAIGFINVERAYKNSTGAAVKVSLMGSAGSSGGAQQGLGALAGLANMAAMMGGAQQGMDTVRVKGNRAIIQENGGRPELMLTLPSGTILTVQPQGGAVTKEQLASVAESFDITALESYIATK